MFDKITNSVFSASSLNDQEPLNSTGFDYFDVMNSNNKYLNHNWLTEFYYPRRSFNYGYNHIFSPQADPVVNTTLLAPQQKKYVVKRQPAFEFVGTQFKGADESILGLIELMNANPEIRGTYRITSLYRPNAKTKSGNTSHHSAGRAVDIVPINGSFDALERAMMQDESIVNYMKRYNLGILDEYTPNGYQKRTGATGNHMHIGPDKLALKCQDNLLAKYGWV